MTADEEEFLRLAMALPPRERWNLGMRLLESLEVKDSESEAAPGHGSPTGGSKQP